MADPITTILQQLGVGIPPVPPGGLPTFPGIPQSGYPNLPGTTPPFVPNPNNPALPNITFPGGTATVTPRQQPATQANIQQQVQALLPFPFNIIPEIGALSNLQASTGGYIAQIEEFLISFASYLAVNSLTILIVIAGIYLLFRPEINKGIEIAKSTAKDVGEVAVAAA